MSKAKHTPGPWSFKPYNGTDALIAELRQMGLKPLRMILNNGSVVVTSEHSRICEVDCQTAFKRGAGHLAECEERDANARLIAAAPETAAERDRLKEVNAALMRECLIASAFLKTLAELIQFNGMDGQAGNCIIVAKNIDAAIAKAENPS